MQSTKSGRGRPAHIPPRINKVRANIETAHAILVSAVDTVLHVVWDLRFDGTNGYKGLVVIQTANGLTTREVTVSRDGRTLRYNSQARLIL